MDEPNWIRVGAAATNWWNALIPLPDSLKPPPTQVLDEISKAGYEGVEVGDSLPSEPEKLGPLLKASKLAAIGGWLPTWHLARSAETEDKSFSEFLDVLGAIGAEVVFITEATHNIALEADGSAPNVARALFPYSIPRLSSEQWRILCEGVARQSRIANNRGFRFAYHPMVSTVVQERDQIEKLLVDIPEVGLVLDTGHLALAGIDPLEMLTAHSERVVHVHLKNVRHQVVERVKNEAMPWTWAVINGVFTVPGDGGLDFRPIFEKLRVVGYRGWLVLEAEQDPSRANPYQDALLARAYLRQVSGW